MEKLILAVDEAVVTCPRCEFRWYYQIGPHFQIAEACVRCGNRLTYEPMSRRDSADIGRRIHALAAELMRG